MLVALTAMPFAAACVFADDDSVVQVRDTGIGVAYEYSWVRLADKNGEAVSTASSSGPVLSFGGRGGITTGPLLVAADGSHSFFSLGQSGIRSTRFCVGVGPELFQVFSGREKESYSKPRVYKSSESLTHGRAGFVSDDEGMDPILALGLCFYHHGYRFSLHSSDGENGEVPCSFQGTAPGCFLVSNIPVLGDKVELSSFAVAAIPMVDSSLSEGDKDKVEASAVSVDVCGGLNVQIVEGVKVSVEGTCRLDRMAKGDLSFSRSDVGLSISLRTSL